MAGIYIHIPFCRKACHYCNFHFSTQLQHIPDLTTAIVKEISLNTGFINDEERIDTIYFGGGTPSLLEPDQLTRLLEAIYQRFPVSSDAELTIEANPDDITSDRLMAWSEAGFNRLSVGMQSFNDEELHWMNRNHSAAQSELCLQLIQASAFSNYTVDLISGSPFCTDANLVNSMEKLLAYRVPHISCYALTIEPGTALQHFVNKGISPPINQEQQARQLELTSNYLMQNGYEHYEISNYALPGYRSRHNSSYWMGVPYFGFGPGAHSYNGKNIRRWNIANNALYIKSILQNQIPFEEELLTAVQQYNEYLMIRLRTSEGVSIQEFQQLFGKKSTSKLMTKMDPLLSSGEVELVDGLSIRLTQKGKWLADGIAAALFEDE